MLKNFKDDAYCQRKKCPQKFYFHRYFSSKIFNFS